MSSLPKTFALCLLLLVCAVSTFAQEETIYKTTEVAPAPEGGLVAFYEYTKENISYPTDAKQKGIKGNVFVQFVVEKDGKLSNIKVVKGLGYGCDEAVITCLRTSPKWKPGKQQGKIVRVQKTLSIQVK